MADSKQTLHGQGPQMSGQEAIHTLLQRLSELSVHQHRLVVTFDHLRGVVEKIIERFSRFSFLMAMQGGARNLLPYGLHNMLGAAHAQQQQQQQQQQRNSHGGGGGGGGWDGSFDRLKSLTESFSHALVKEENKYRADLIGKARKAAYRSGTPLDVEDIKGMLDMPDIKDLEAKVKEIESNAYSVGKSKRLVQQNHQELIASLQKLFVDAGADPNILKVGLPILADSLVGSYENKGKRDKLTANSTVDQEAIDRHSKVVMIDAETVGVGNHAGSPDLISLSAVMQDEEGKYQSARYVSPMRPPVEELHKAMGKPDFDDSKLSPEQQRLMGELAVTARILGHIAEGSEDKKNPYRKADMEFGFGDVKALLDKWADEISKQAPEVRAKFVEFMGKAFEAKYALGAHNLPFDQPQLLSVLEGSGVNLPKDDDNKLMSVDTMDAVKVDGRNSGLNEVIALAGGVGKVVEWLKAHGAPEALLNAVANRDKIHHDEADSAAALASLHLIQSKVEETAKTPTPVKVVEEAPPSPADLPAPVKIEKEAPSPPEAPPIPVKVEEEEKAPTRAEELDALAENLEMVEQKDGHTILKFLDPEPPTSRSQPLEDNDTYSLLEDKASEELYAYGTTNESFSPSYDDTFGIDTKEEEKKRLRRSANNDPDEFEFGEEFFAEFDAVLDAAAAQGMEAALNKNSTKQFGTFPLTDPAATEGSEELPREAVKRKSIDEVHPGLEQLTEFEMLRVTGALRRLSEVTGLNFSNFVEKEGTEFRVGKDEDMDGFNAMYDPTSGGIILSENALKDSLDDMKSLYVLLAHEIAHALEGGGGVDDIIEDTYIEGTIQRNIADTASQATRDYVEDAYPKDYEAKESELFAVEVEKAVARPKDERSVEVLDALNLMQHPNLPVNTYDVIYDLDDDQAEEQGKRKPIYDVIHDQEDAESKDALAQMNRSSSETYPIDYDYNGDLENDAARLLGSSDPGTPPPPPGDGGGGDGTGDDYEPHGPWGRGRERRRANLRQADVAEAGMSYLLEGNKDVKKQTADDLFDESATGFQKAVKFFAGNLSKQNLDAKKWATSLREQFKEKGLIGIGAESAKKALPLAATMGSQMLSTGNPVAFQTLMDSFALLAGRLSIMLLPTVMDLIGWLQGLANTVQNLSASTKGWISFTVQAAAVGSILIIALNTLQNVVMGIVAALGLFGVKLSATSMMTGIGKLAAAGIALTAAAYAIEAAANYLANRNGPKDAPATTEKHVADLHKEVQDGMQTEGNIWNYLGKTDFGNQRHLDVLQQEAKAMGLTEGSEGYTKFMSNSDEGTQFRLKSKAFQLSKEYGTTYNKEVAKERESQESWNPFAAKKEANENYRIKGSQFYNMGLQGFDLKKMMQSSFGSKGDSPERRAKLQELKEKNNAYESQKGLLLSLRALAASPQYSDIGNAYKKVQLDVLSKDPMLLQLEKMQREGLEKMIQLQTESNEKLTTIAGESQRQVGVDR